MTDKVYKKWYTGKTVDAFRLQQNNHKESYWKFLRGEETCIMYHHYDILHILRHIMLHILCNIHLYNIHIKYIFYIYNIYT